MNVGYVNYDTLDQGMRDICHRINESDWVRSIESCDGHDDKRPYVLIEVHQDRLPDFLYKAFQAFARPCPDGMDACICGHVLYETQALGKLHYDGDLNVERVLVAGQEGAGWSQTRAAVLDAMLDLADMIAA